MEKMTGKEALELALEALVEMDGALAPAAGTSKYGDALATLATLNVYFSEKPPEGVKEFVYIEAAMALSPGIVGSPCRDHPVEYDQNGVRRFDYRYRYDSLVTESDKGGE